MITIIRSITELMVVTKSRDQHKRNKLERDMKSNQASNKNDKTNKITKAKKMIRLPNLPKTERRRWTKSKEAVSRFFDELDYNNQIQSTYDLTLLDSQKKYDHNEAA